uniref:Uncharacterized protein n=1 Tax=Rhizophora mucronata TaxID=61149 RepID=A0A2P2QVD4_RHIMU
MKKKKFKLYESIFVKIGVKTKFPFKLLTCGPKLSLAKL